jgi:hypothetical protein
MPGVRNGVLARGVSSGLRELQVGTVPVGFTWLLKVVHLWNSSTTAAPLAVKLTSADGLVRAYLVSETLEPNAIHSWEGWTALNPGDRLSMDVSVPGVNLWAAGAELPGVAQFSSFH